MKIIVSFVFVLILITGCQTIGDPVDNAETQRVTRAQLELQFDEIQEFITSGNCTESQQCQFLPYGRKACGGPKGYVVFSADIDIEKLKEMINRYTTAEIAYNEQNQVMSDCSLPAEPTEIDCVNGDCVRIQ